MVPLETSVHGSAEGPQYRLHKGCDGGVKLQVGSTLPADPGAACTAGIDSMGGPAAGQLAAGV